MANFKEAGLLLSTTTSRNTFRTNVPIVRLSITERPVEHFSVDVGDEKNIVKVLSIDEDFKQLVLLVKEPRREYKIPLAHKSNLTSDYKLVPKEEIHYVTKYTDPMERTYLMGMDESSLFISGLPKEKVNTVADAHQVLKHKGVVAAEKEGREVKRQGEYFFVPLTKVEEKDLLDKVVADKRILTVRGRLQRGGHRPHFVRRLMRMRRKRKVYAQGHVTHEQHIPLHLPTWHRVYRNRETESPGIFGFVD